jgi:hypothetical protein
MKKILFLILLLAVAVVHLEASWDKGFNFRSSSGFVTDGTNESFVGFDVYPNVYGNGATAGWTNAVACSLNIRDRDSSVDRRLAGIQFTVSATDCVYQIDLPAAGAYDIRLAAGDGTSSTWVGHVQIKDGSSVLVDISHNTESGWRDATDTLYSAMAWPGSNTAARVNFSGSTLTLRLSVDNGASVATIAHLFISQVSGGGGGPAPPSPFFNLLSVAPDIYAQPDTAIGQAAVDQCLAQPNTSTLVCEVLRGPAMQQEADNRFRSAFQALYSFRVLIANFIAGLMPGGSILDPLAVNGLRWMPKNN